VDVVSRPHITKHLQQGIKSANPSLVITAGERTKDRGPTAPGSCPGEERGQQGPDRKDAEHVVRTGSSARDVPSRACSWPEQGRGPPDQLDGEDRCTDRKHRDACVEPRARDDVERGYEAKRDQGEEPRARDDVERGYEAKRDQGEARPG
jgi:hypothetical protein